jgi:hypothetical protein
MVEDYLRTFAQIRQSGERVIIDGPCLSACTLVLSTIPKKRICVTSRAVLGFHAARWVDPRTGRMSRAPEATRIVTQSYPPGVVRGLRSGAGLRGRSFISTGGSSGLCIDGARRLEVVSSHEWSQAQRGADRSPCFSVSAGTRAMSERVNRCFAPSIVTWPLRVEIDAKSTGPHPVHKWRNADDEYLALRGRRRARGLTSSGR